ncbi:MAG: hypothetical protein H6876_02865 [Hyphomicrobiaceae bacterium]|nr:hypothetical protein [Hyphomicrobiaceae bacterium]
MISPGIERSRRTDRSLPIIILDPDQLVHVYRNGVRIAVSTCSTGRPDDTPTGVFTILKRMTSSLLDATTMRADAER